MKRRPQSIGRSGRCRGWSERVVGLVADAPDGLGARAAHGHSRAVVHVRLEVAARGVGAGLGPLVANLIWTRIEGDPHPFVVVLFSVAGALLATWLQRYVIILGTAFGGVLALPLLIALASE